MTTRMSPDLISGIYLNYGKAQQCRMVANTGRRKEEGENLTAKKTDACKYCLQHDKSEAFKK